MTLHKSYLAFLLLTIPFLYISFYSDAQIIDEKYSFNKNLETDNLAAWTTVYQWPESAPDVWLRLNLHAQSRISILKINGFFQSVGLCKSSNCAVIQEYYPLLRPPYQATPQQITIQLTTTPHSDTTILLRLSGIRSKPSIQFLPETEYLRTVGKEIFISALFCGLILAIIIVTVYYFITEKKLLYRCYAAYITFLLFSSTIHLDSLTHLIVSLLRHVTNSPDAYYIFLVKLFNVAAILTSLRFGYVFFDLKKKSLKLSVLFKIQALVVLLTYAFVFLTPIQLHRTAVFFITILTFLVLLFTSGYLWIKYQKRSYLIYNIAYILFFSGYLINIYSILQKSIYSPVYFISGVLFETLLLSYALVLIITEEKATTQVSLIRTTEELLSRINEFERFSSILAHNLRAPIARLLGLVNLLTSKSYQDLQEIINMIQKVGEELDLTVRKIRQILDLKKEQITLFELVNVKEILNKIQPKIQEKIKETGAEVNISLTGDETILGNESYVSGILCSILENCFKFREPTRKLKVDVSSKTDNNYLYITIKDNGSGFPLNEVSSKLFEPFQRFHNNVEGKGLGLYFAKVQAEKIGGEILMESIPNKGTTVMLKFPKNISKFKKELLPNTFAPDFTIAKEKHLEWMYRIKKLLNGEKNAISIEAAVSHYQCDLGKWFYSEGKAKFGHIKEIQEFEKEHILLHMLTKEIIMAVEEGNVKVANEQFQKLQITSENLLKILTEVEKIVYAPA